MLSNFVHFTITDHNTQQCSQDSARPKKKKVQQNIFKTLGDPNSKRLVHETSRTNRNPTEQQNSEEPDQNFTN